MFEYLQQIDDGLYDRYKTLEKNIKAASNSFYDAFLSLQEHFLRVVIEDNGLQASRETCGAMLKRADVQELLLKKYDIDNFTYGKMSDYTKKANEHKHSSEKNIENSTIVSYLHLFYDVSSSYAQTKGLNVPPFNGRYFKELFGRMEKTDERLIGIEENQKRQEEKLETIKEETINAVRSEIRKGQKLANLSPEMNRHNQNQTLKNFLRRASKKYNWCGSEELFNKSKYKLLYVQIALILVGIISTIISSICFELYSTYTLFENIVLIQTIILAVYTAKSKKFYSDYELATHTADKFEFDGNNFVYVEGLYEKKRYKWFRRIAYVAVVLNILCIWLMGTWVVVNILATIFELAFLVLMIVANSLRDGHFILYRSIYMTAMNESGTEFVTLVYCMMDNKYYSLEDYEKKYSVFA